MENENLFRSIVKRNGIVETFNHKKITQAIEKAGNATGEFGKNIADKLTLKVLSILHETAKNKKPSVEEIQDIVEEVLLSSIYKKTAKAYILYRDQHTQIREITSSFNVNLVDQYLQKIDWQVNENSNMSYSLQGLNNYISSEISKVYWLNKIYPDNIRKAHCEGDLHIHDLGLLGAYCVGWDLQDLLISGFKGASGKAESKPAKHFRTALGQIINFFYTLQGESAGAQAFSNFDTLLAPFIYYDKLSYKDVKQSLQEFLFNINVPTRVGFQTPFTNLTMDLTVAPHYKDEPVIIGVKRQNKKYGDFQKEMDILNQAFLELMLEGDAKGRVFTFPIPTYNITTDFDWDNENIKALWDITAKYGIPYFANFVNSDMKPEDARSMCCRLRIDNRELQKRGGGLFGASPLTGSIGVVTINLPRIGYTAKNEIDFLEKLKNNMGIAKQSLEIKRRVLEKFTSGNLYPYMSFYLRSVKQRFDQYWQNHFSTIGLVGLNEACLNLFGQDIGSQKGKEFGNKVLDFMRNILIDYQQETGNNYNLEATPAEGTSYRLAKLDAKLYPDIISASPVKETPFYTNSSQLPVNYTDDIFENLDLQDSMQSKYTGGTVLHIFVGEKVKDTQALKMFIKTVCKNYKLPYFSITPTFSICPNCGYIEGERNECPKCKNETCEVYSRVVGYLRPVSLWNKGKKEEFKIRKTYCPCSNNNYKKGGRG
ncbi:MAG: ribonucleoside triphosphate reductase [Endomicrobium sp.]|jgi:ribonucleoside-triphosphate reductase|nr:ribonucleoside triphosphate reductase [Endomicrobium sp.]